MGWRQELRSYFTFNNREKRGVSALLLVLISLASLHLWLRSKPSEPLDFEAAYHETGHFQQVGASSQPYTDSVSRWVDFDVNAASVLDFVESGLDEKLAKRIVNYRSKAGAFGSVDALSAIYGMDTAWLREAAVHATALQAGQAELDFHAPKELGQTNKKLYPQRSSIDLNRADTTQLLTIPGVGKFYAKEVVKLRDRLGGYFRYDQLVDIYKIRDETITAISDYTFIDTTAIQRLNINMCTVDQLGRHPYLGWKSAKVVVAYRQQHGDYQSKQDILKTKVVSDSVYRNIAPYLSVK